MKALLLTSSSTLEYTDFSDPRPAEDEVLLRIRACGICGSDLNGWDGSSGRRNPPLIMGHEAAGEVAAVGPQVVGWKPGDRVTFDSTISCGSCHFCRAGETNLCLHRRVVGVSPLEYKQHGAFAEYLALPARILHRVPDSLTFEEAAFAEPLSIALHAVRRVALTPAGTAVVVGSGMIGLLVIQALRWKGVGRIIAVDLVEERLALARQLGATHTLNSGTGDITAGVADLTDGLGADASFEVVGIQATVNLAIQLLRRGGTGVLVGNLAAATKDFPLQRVVTHEITLAGTCGCAGEYPQCLELLQRGDIETRPLVSAVAPLSEGAAWFKRLTFPGGNYLKVILKP